MHIWTTCPNMGLLSIYGSGMHMYNRVRSAIYGVIARHICVGNGCMGIWAHGYMRTWDISVGAVARHICVSKET